jgi:hypothetical protein
MLIVFPALVCLRYSLAANTFDEGAVKEQLKRVPLRFGDWESKSPEEEDESAFKDEKYPGFMRRYENRGRQVLLLISGGPSGPLVYLHKPEQCYTAIGFSIHDESTVMRQVADNTFAAADFTRKLPLSEYLRIYWGWSGDGNWAAPKEPRLRFTGNQLLYRMYVVERTKSPSDEHEGSACEEFLKVAIPKINQALFVGE